MKEKARATKRFLAMKQAEYEHLAVEIEQLRGEVGKLNDSEEKR